MCILPVHPLTNFILGQEDDLSRDIDKHLKFNDLIDASLYLSLSVSELGDREAHILEIEFHHGAIYQYVDVPERVYEELMSSPLREAYFRNGIGDLT